MPFKFGVGLMAAVLGGCVAGGVRYVPVAGPTDLARGAERYPDLTASELAAGRTVLVARCSTCHQTPLPSSLSPGEWPAQVAEMKGRAHLDASQRRAVERYLVTMALAAGNVTQSESGSSR